MKAKPKFNLGDTVFYVESSCHYGTKVPCPVCFGKRKVTVILGNDERVDTECGHCSHGFDRPSGVAHTWGPHASVVAGAITGVRNDYGTWKYEMGHHRCLSEHELFTEREEAELLRVEKLKEVTEQKAAYERDGFVNATKKQIWSAGYHRNQIKYHERHIEWHKMRLCMVKEKPTAQESA